MKKVELQDIQGFLLKGYGKMRTSRYYLLKVEDKDLAKKWIDQISNDISDGEHHPETTSLNIAFTHPGLSALGMAAENLRNFAREFREGMDTAHRNRMLGDLGSSDPRNWRWGSKTNETVTNEQNIHCMLMVFALDDLVLAEYSKELETVFLSMGMSIVLPLDGQLLPDNKIHLGFRDGIGQPAIAGTGRVAHPNNVVATGEFILGYQNEYGVYSDSPFITVQQGDTNLLPVDAGGSGLKDIGHNGSYLVYRQMEERVDIFWSYINEKTKSENGSLNEVESIKLAAKMVGRWPSGAPLVKFPDADPGGLIDDDDFGYQPDDGLGQKCPFGSHIRRSNPRNAFEDNNPKKSISLTNKHRIIRRGRSYGESLVGTPTNHHSKDEIGLHFMCFNTDISNQFEFIMHTWANFPGFQNLYHDPDPLVGVSDVEQPDKIPQNFTIQGCPINKTVTDLQRFVTIKGGAYFFFPSITAIKYLATI